MSEVRPRVSVCMATYAGEAYVAEQLASILIQLGADDEVVVIDDASPDGTVALVAAIAEGDPRIRLTARADNRGYVATFQEALTRARGEYLLLADQDDVWLPGRLDVMVAALRGADVVASNLTTLNGPGAIRGPFGQDDWRLRAEDSGRTVRNVLAVLAGNRPYYGCAMGLRRSALALVLPFPPWLRESHDLWIALCGIVSRRMRHLPERTLARRLHETNQTPTRPRSAPAVIASRLRLIRAVIEILRRQRRA